MDVIDDVIYAARAGDLEDLQSNRYPVQALNGQDEHGNTALHMAAANGHLGTMHTASESISHLLDICQFLLPHITHVDTQNNEGNTPLHWAALNGHLAIVEALVAKGADCKIKNQANRTPIYEAQAFNHEDVAEFFLKTMVEDAQNEEGEEEVEVEDVDPSTSHVDS
ncbi:hypothetical protein BZG36_03432 [Bifiguratus adelaidae]|uniref:Uncharacterized protein n=1 Tax=Bifiguratus adelaidae TaxID=1938954 RepID=A0A261XYW5_9FUNG|nr:hypothetical protein BZG36_03432 [Bifiguratus adelaidae]